MKKKIFIAAAVVLAAIILLLGIYAVGFGFTKITSVYVSDYIVSEDGTEMDIRIFVGSSVGFVRRVAARQEPDGRIYLDCYSAFGGINGSLGAKSEFVIGLPADADTILINRNDGYDVILVKDAGGVWQRA